MKDINQYQNQSLFFKLNVFQLKAKRNEHIEQENDISYFPMHMNILCHCYLTKFIFCYLFSLYGLFGCSILCSQQNIFTLYVCVVMHAHKYRYMHIMITSHAKHTLYIMQSDTQNVSNEMFSTKVPYIYIWIVYEFRLYEQPLSG